MAVRKLLMIATIALVSVSLNGKWVGAEVHHIVGGDRGWEPSTDLAAWSSGRNFTVGDKIWFTYSVAQGIVVELKTREEYDSCDVTNPIRMYTEGIDSVTLKKAGVRYFASSNSEICNGGLKLHVEVMPQQLPKYMWAVADGPIPSGSARLIADWAWAFAGFWVFYGLLESNEFCFFSGY